jgi:hypothetical protein
MGNTDERDLRSALRAIREAYPTSVTAEFQASDQGSYGFVLNDVILADGTRASDVEGAIDTLMDAVDEHINDISWNGVMNDDRGGAATVKIPAILDEYQAAGDDYMADLLQLIDGFNYMGCEHCGNDINEHSIAPDPLGKPHLYCLDDPEDRPEAEVQQPGTHRVLVTLVWSEVVSYSQDIEIDVPDGFEEAGGRLSDLIDADDSLEIGDDIFGLPTDFVWPEDYKTNWLKRADFSVTMAVNDRDVTDVRAA